MLMKGLCLCSAVCDSSCLTCSGPHDTSCTSCSEGLATDAHGRCVTPTTCPSHHYSNQDGECHLCHKYCHECSGPHQDQCLSCYQNHYLLSEFMLLRHVTHLWKMTSVKSEYQLYQRGIALSSPLYLKLYAFSRSSGSV